MENHPLNNHQLNKIFSDTYNLCPIPLRCIVVFAKSVKFHWNRPYLGFWEQNDKTYFFINLVYYHLGIRLVIPKQGS